MHLMGSRSGHATCDMRMEKQGVIPASSSSNGLAAVRPRRQLLLSNDTTKDLEHGNE